MLLKTLNLAISFAYRWMFSTSISSYDRSMDNRKHAKYYASFREAVDGLPCDKEKEM